MTQHNSADNAGRVPPVSGGTRPPDDEQEERIVVRDRRRIDPNGTQPRESADSPDTAAAESEAADTTEPAAAGASEAASAGTAQPTAAGTPATDGSAPTGDAESAGAGSAETGAAASADAAALRTELDERTRDLKRVVAEYANYRRRVDRDRALAGEQATGAVLASLLPVLDDLDRAREHGDLVGPFATVADQLVSVLTKAGLTPFCEVGDPFDPMHHEAVAHSLSADVTEPTCVMVMRRGYRHGERMLRPAMVAVADPEEPAAEPAAQESGDDRGDDASEK